MTTFAEFIHDKGLSIVALLRASRAIESHTREDRALTVQRKQKRKAAKEGSYTDAGIAKPRSGRALTDEVLSEALADGRLSPKVRGKIVRAVNFLLAKKSEAAVTVRQVLGAVPSTRKPENEA